MGGEPKKVALLFPVYNSHAHSKRSNCKARTWCVYIPSISLPQIRVPSKHCKAHCTKNCNAFTIFSYFDSIYPSQINLYVPTPPKFPIHRNFGGVVLIQTVKGLMGGEPKKVALLFSVYNSHNTSKTL